MLYAIKREAHHGIHNYRYWVRPDKEDGTLRLTMMDSLDKDCLMSKRKAESILERTDVGPDYKLMRVKLRPEPAK